MFQRNTYYFLYVFHNTWFNPIPSCSTILEGDFDLLHIIAYLLSFIPNEMSNIVIRMYSLYRYRIAYGAMII